jgi:predicted O-methyltransferase YrrM
MTLPDRVRDVRGTAGRRDLVFNDVAKHQYLDAFRAAVPRLRSGSLFVTDNALWGGSVCSPLDVLEDDANTRGVVELNRLCYASEELFSTILPIRDGLLVCLKR